MNSSLLIINFFIFSQHTNTFSRFPWSHYILKLSHFSSPVHMSTLQGAIVSFPCFSLSFQPIPNEFHSTVPLPRPTMQNCLFLGRWQFLCYQQHSIHEQLLNLGHIFFPLAFVHYSFLILLCLASPALNVECYSCVVSSLF